MLISDELQAEQVYKCFCVTKQKEDLNVLHGKWQELPQKHGMQIKPEKM
jgi:hypothetical protein